MRSAFMRLLDTKSRDVYIDPYRVIGVEVGGEKVCHLHLQGGGIQNIRTSAASRVEMIDEWIEENRPRFETMESFAGSALPELSFAVEPEGPRGEMGEPGIPDEEIKDEIDITPPEVAVEPEEPKELEERPSMTFKPTAEGIANHDISD